MNKMKLLIICQYFPPENKIGAIRPSRIAKYISKVGDVSVTVLTVMPPLCDAPSEEVMYGNVRVFRADECALTRLMHRKKQNSGPADYSVQSVHHTASIRDRIINILFVLRLRMELYSHVKNGKRILRGFPEAFDVVLSTYNTEFGHKVAHWYKRRYPNVKWIADFRDSTWLTTSPKKDIRKGNKFAAWVAKACDSITAVGEGIIETHKEEFGTTPCYVIPNGYDPDDRVTSLTNEDSDQQKDGVFRLVYTGDLYAGKRDLTPLFRALSCLIENKTIDADRILVVYAGTDGGTFYRQASKYPLVKTLTKGLLNHSDAIQLQDSACGLILASWCTTGDKGVLTGKYFEYLSANRPIICLICGNETGSTLSNLIREHNLGVCYEEAADETDFMQLCAYLSRQYKYFVSEGKVEYDPETSYTMRYAYKNIAQEMLEIMTMNNQSKES